MFCSTVDEKWERLLGKGIAWKSDGVQWTTDLMGDMVIIKNNLVVLVIMLKPFIIFSLQYLQHQKTGYC